MKHNSKTLIISDTKVAVLANVCNRVSINTSYCSNDIKLCSRYSEKDEDGKLNIKFDLVASFFDKQGIIEDVCQFSIDTERASNHILLTKSDYSKARNVEKYKVSQDEDMYNDLINFFDSQTFLDDLDSVTKQVVSFAVEAFKYNEGISTTRPSFVDLCIEKANEISEIEDTRDKK